MKPSSSQSTRRFVCIARAVENGNTSTTACGTVTTYWSPSQSPITICRANSTSASAKYQ